MTGLNIEIHTRHGEFVGRATKDIDVFVDQPLETMAATLLAAGFPFEKPRRDFIRGDVPVHLITTDQLGKSPRQVVEIDGISTVSLADLVEMKLTSGSKNILRAQDLADVIGSIRQNGLTSEFARQLDKIGLGRLSEACEGN